MLKKRLALAALVLALGLAATGGSGAQTRAELTEQFQQTHPLAAGGRVRLSNINGKVRVAAWDRAEVKIEAVKRAYRAERLREVEIRVSATAGGVEIETDYPESSWHGRGVNNADDRPAAVDYALTVPRGANLDEIKLVNGALEIEGVGGAVHASSVNGPVTARNLSGRVRLSVVNGLLDASFDRLGEPVSLSAVNGDLEVRIPSDASAHLRASTVHGRISNDFNLPVRQGKYVGRNLEGRLGAGGARLELSNVNGAISIRRAADGRAQSPATNLLSEAPDEDFDALDAQIDSEVTEATREAAVAAREAARELRAAQTDVERELRATQRDVAREQRAELRERQRELNQAAREAARAARELAHAEVVVEPHARQIQRESKSLPAGGPARVRLETFDGNVRVRGWDKPEVMYTAVKRAHSEREMQGIRILTQSGPEVVVRAEFDKSQAQEVVERDGKVVMFSSGASVELDVYVPRQAALVLSSGDGRLSVEGVTGELELRTGDGPVDVLGGGGRLKINTGDGPIRVENFEGDADARTGDGRITLDGRFRQLAARTGDGTISLALPEGASADIETHATSVSNDGVAAAADAAGADAEQRVRRWRVGAGGQLYSLRTGDGLIILRRR